MKPPWCEVALIGSAPASGFSDLKDGMHEHHHGRRGCGPRNTTVSGWEGAGNSNGGQVGWCKATGDTAHTNGGYVLTEELPMRTVPPINYRAPTGSSAPVWAWNRII